MPRLPLFERMKNRTENKNGCWIWAGTTTRGYGKTTANAGRGRRDYRVHRLMYELKFGEIPEGMYTDHLCKQKLCVNPDHLEVVTPAENTRRSAPKLNFTLVNNIKGHYLKGLKQSDIAEMYKINQSTVSRILNNKRWRTM